ncbi:MAG: hypothetical protein JSW60_02580 [Thermoplasmatales archaeon]|nr:MAG: hypothetical protein JSW60_02580 [Thermoplasmatales archaeon]
MKKQLVILGIAVLLLAFGLSGCTDIGKESKKFVGTWKLTEDSGWVNFTFLSNGSYFTIDSEGMNNF